LDKYQNYLIEKIEKAKPLQLPAPVLLREIKKMGYQGEITTLRMFLKEHQQKLEKEPVIRFETEPGQQCQVDWTWMNKGADCIGAFVAILGFSRRAYVEFVDNEKEETLLRCHQNMFEYFEGVPNQILYDNMKTVVIQRDRYGKDKHGFQKTFWDFAKHFGFVPKLCRPYRAQTKGKVERFNCYLKRSFYYPLITQHPESRLICRLNREVKKWLREVADERVIRELKTSPNKRFKIEKDYLQAIPEENIVFIGPSGVGKTHLAVSLG
jgi:transposase